MVPSAYRPRVVDDELDVLLEESPAMVALEVKLVATPRRDDTCHLRWLLDRVAPTCPMP